MASDEDRRRMVQTVVETLLGTGQYTEGAQLQKTAEAFEQKIFTEADSAADYFSRINKRLSKVKALSAPAAVAQSVKEQSDKKYPAEAISAVPAPVAAGYDPSSRPAPSESQPDDIHVCFCIMFCVHIVNPLL